MMIKYTIEFPENLNTLIKNLVFNYQKMYIEALVVNTNNGKKVRVSFEGDKKMKDDFIKELNKEIRNNKSIRNNRK